MIRGGRPYIDLEIFSNSPNTFNILKGAFLSPKQKIPQGLRLLAGLGLLGLLSGLTGRLGPLLRRRGRGLLLLRRRTQDLTQGILRIGQGRILQSRPQHLIRLKPSH